MTKIQMLREFVNKRLIDVAEEICGMFERTFAEYEEEANRSRQKEIDYQHTTHPPIVSVKEEEILLDPEQHCTEWRPSLEDQDTEPPQTDELRQGHERLQSWEDEAGTMRPSTCTKSEYDYPQPSLLYLNQNEEYNAFLGGASEPSSQTLSPDCSVAESNDMYICNECGKEFYQSGTYIRESCDECVEVFNQNMGIVPEPMAEEKAAYHVGETSMQRGKKRTRNKLSTNEHKRLVNLGQSYTYSDSKDVLIPPGKRVREKNCAYCCYKCNRNFPEPEREKIFRHFWGIEDCVRQKHFIIAHVLKRDKKNTTKKDSRRQYTIEYFFTSEGRKIRVCREFFLRTLDVSDTFSRSAVAMCPSLK